MKNDISQEPWSVFQALRYGIKRKERRKLTLIKSQAMQSVQAYKRTTFGLEEKRYPTSIRVKEKPLDTLI